MTGCEKVNMLKQYVFKLRAIESSLNSREHLAPEKAVTQSPPAVKIHIKLAPKAQTKLCRTSAANGKKSDGNSVANFPDLKWKGPDLVAVHTLRSAETESKQATEPHLTDR
ncbi:hypothetical protein ROHU_017129 [Labeo rohita]|uniref:Uncharacterized protein n=1 Tax=Labeo rohita TaxID=84645 RepID=A0A498NHF0_LABRO|nr:hypothetical protein ROHU_017129 [Labeo rohita]